MEQYHGPKDFKMIDWIGGFVITFKLRELDVRWNGLLYDPDREQRISIDVIIVDWDGIAEFLNPLIHFLQLLIKKIISIMDL